MAKKDLDDLYYKLRCLKKAGRPEVAAEYKVIQTLNKWTHMFFIIFQLFIIYKYIFIIFLTYYICIQKI